MNTQADVQSAQNTQAVPEVPEVANPALAQSTKPADMNTIKKQYFPSTKLEAGNEAANEAIEIVTACAGSQQFNFDPANALPAGYGLAIAPKNERDPVTKTTNTIGVTIAAIPEYDTIAATEAGQSFIRETITNAVISKLQNAVRTRSDGSTAASIPFTVTDFITSARPEGVLVAFRKLAGIYVKVLKSNGMTLMTPDILRQILTSSEFAETQFPRVPQASWEKILQSMIKKASEEELATSLLSEWLETRDTAGLPKMEDVDLSDLDFANI